MKGDLNLQVDGAQWAPGELDLEKSLAEFSSVKLLGFNSKKPPDILTKDHHNL